MMNQRNGLWTLVLWLPAVVVGCGGNATMNAIDEPQEFQPKVAELEKLAAGLPGDASSPPPAK